MKARSMCLLPLLAADLRGLRVGHVLPVDPEDTGAVDGPLEAAEGAVDGLLVAYFDADGQGDTCL